MLAPTPVPPLLPKPPLWVWIAMKVILPLEQPLLLRFLLQCSATSPPPPWHLNDCNGGGGGGGGGGGWTLTRIGGSAALRSSNASMIPSTCGTDLHLCHPQTQPPTNQQPPQASLAQQCIDVYMTILATITFHPCQI